MNEREEARKTINAVDRELAELFEKRMRAVRSVFAYKMAHDLPVYDEEREKENLRRNTALLQDPALRPYFADFYQYLMDVSKKYQNDMKENYGREEDQCDADPGE